MYNIHNVFNIRLSLFFKQLNMNEEDILRITDELLLRRSFILVTVFSFIYPGTILLVLFTNICLCISYPGQCIRKCSSFSIFPWLFIFFFDNNVNFKHQLINIKQRIKDQNLQNQNSNICQSSKLNVFSRANSARQASFEALQFTPRVLL
jgi:hypothetical protein